MEKPPVKLVRVGAIAHVVLARPEVRNALNGESIAALQHAFEDLAADASVRAIVLSGEGNAFCAGADIAWMRASLELDRAANLAEARALSRMFRTIDRIAKPTIAKVHGAALGGGAGLAAVCDIVIAANDTIFGFTETKLGLIPAVISPFVLAKIGSTHARALALTGERFDANRARAIGLVHEAVPPEQLESTVARVCHEIRSASPAAIAAAKALFAALEATSYDDSLELTAEAIALQRTSAEGQEGLHAFLERRPSAWSR
jgi:methylglutaconyl-CoA hydratase